MMTMKAGLKRGRTWFFKGRRGDDVCRQVTCASMPLSPSFSIPQVVSTIGEHEGIENEGDRGVDAHVNLANWL
jgi:hypothetical protein